MQNSNTIEKRSQSTRQMVYMGVAIALCVVATMVLIPMPGGAMVHMGSAALYIIGIVFGRWVGAVGGGIGSMIFDAIVGLTGYTPFSLVIRLPRRLLRTHAESPAQLRTCADRDIDRVALDFGRVCGCLVGGHRQLADGDCQYSVFAHDICVRDCRSISGRSEIV